MEHEKAKMLFKYLKLQNQINPILVKKYLQELEFCLSSIDIAHSNLSGKSEEILQKLGSRHYDKIFNLKSSIIIIDNMKNKELSSNISPFIVHGHDNEMKKDLKDFLQNKFGFREPIILEQQSSRGETIIEKFERHATKTKLVFVLLTPDDKLTNIRDNEGKGNRSRQNVIFELGYFIGRLGRKSGKIILLKKGEIDIPSDIHGVIYIDITKGIEESLQKIRNELSEFFVLR